MPDRRHVRDVDEALAINEPLSRAVSAPVGSRHELPRMRLAQPRVATARKYVAVVGAAMTPNAAPHSRVRLFQHRVEHRRQIAGRGVDHLQHLSGRGLLLQRLALLGDQPRVLHRDHRLGGEVLQQRDLLVGERPHLLAVDRDAAEQRLVLAQRHAEQRASAAKIDERAAIGSPRGNARSSARSAMWTSARRSMQPPEPAVRTRPDRLSRMNSANAAGTPRMATAWKRSPS